MAEKTYAFLRGEEIVNTAVFDNPTESLLEEFKTANNVDAIIECPPVVMPGYLYINEEFVPLPPFPSWTLNRETRRFDPPIPYPENDESGIPYTWNEETLSWVFISLESSEE